MIQAVVWPYLLDAKIYRRERGINEIKKEKRWIITTPRK